MACMGPRAEYVGFDRFGSFGPVFYVMLSSSKREGKAVPKLFRMQEAYFSLEGLGFRV